MQVAELHGRLQQAQGDNARLLSMRRPSNPGSKAADTCSNSNHSETVSEDSNAASARHIQRSNSSQSEACASEPEAQVQHSDRGPDLNIRDAADVSVLLSGELCKWLQKVADSLTADAAKLATASQQQPEPGTAHDEGKAFNWGFPVSQTSPVRDRSGPVRPATAAPADGGKQRPRRQWSAQHAMQPDEGSQGMERPERARPLTAVEDIHQRPASARNTHRHLHVDVEYYDSVPPTRMREEVLQQAREDYIREKNRVREKRLQELTLNRTTAELTTDT